MKVSLQVVTDKAEAVIEKAARICYDSTSKKDRGEFITNLIKSGHESVIEHASATFIVEGISRACSHQLVRHRLASYSQRSQRYVNEDGFKFVTPRSIGIGSPTHEVYVDLMNTCAEFYSTLIGMGVPKEDARFVLPNACQTTIVVTMNFRELRHFFKVRLSPKAQWEIRELAGKMLELVYDHAPSVFEDFLIAKIRKERMEFHG